MEEKLRIINERMRRIDRERLRIIEREGDNLGILPSHHYVLMQLSREGKAASQAQIAELLHVSPARVTLVMRQLDAEGFIERKSGKDGRRNEIILTEKGKDVLAKSRAFVTQLNEETYRDFSPEEIEQFHAYLERVLGRLKKIYENMKSEGDQ